MMWIGDAGNSLEIKRFLAEFFKYKYGDYSFIGCYGSTVNSGKSWVKIYRQRGLLKWARPNVCHRNMDICQEFHRIVCRSKDIVF